MMVKNLPFILLFFLNYNMEAQSFEMPLDSGQWRYNFLAYDEVQQQYNTFCLHYTAVGDTLINDKLYFKIENEYMNHIGFFREENRQVFYIPNPIIYEWNSDFEAFKVFDFNLQTGDSTTLYLFEE